jgi:hypothetical protein
VPEQMATAEEWERVMAPMIEAHQRSLLEKVVL